jgi:hypothetical protein
MYKNLGYPQAPSLLGGLAFAFSILPFLLIAYREQIQQKSRVAKQIAWQQEGKAVQAVMSMTVQHEKDPVRKSSAPLELSFFRLSSYNFDAAPLHRELESASILLLASPSDHFRCE